ncbi:MAG: serine hydrolase domain-containing protein [Phycisphaerae bacterium]
MVASHALPVRLLCLVALVCSAAAGATGAAAAAAGAAGADQGRLEAVRLRHGVPAMGLAVVRAEGPPVVVVTGRRSQPDATPAAEDDAWHIGSCGKAVTATLAARLVERGLITWDTTLADALPALAAEAKGPYRGITLRQLLAHRAGIPGASADRQLLGLGWTQSRDAARPMPERRMEVARAVLQSEPTPIDEFAYSNWGYLLAGCMLEAVAGDSFESLVEREVFVPLGMASAGFGVPPTLAGHRQFGNGWLPLAIDNPPVLAPAGTMHMNLADWARFAQLHLGKMPGYLKAETLAELQTPYPGSEQRYAMGWGVADDGRLLHAGSNTVWFAQIVLDREAGFAVLVAANAPAAEAVEEATWAGVDEAASPPSPTTQP